MSLENADVAERSPSTRLAPLADTAGPRPSAMGVNGLIQIQKAQAPTARFEICRALWHYAVPVVAKVTGNAET